MRDARLVIALTLAMSACWRGPAEPPAPASPDRPPQDADTQWSRCRPPQAEKLASFYEVRMRSTYWIEMYDDGAGWQPIEHLPMPHHHATRIELTNAAAFEGLFRRGPRRARFVLEMRARELAAAAAGPWRMTYRALILEACPLRARL